MRKIYIRYVNGSHIIHCALHRIIFVTTSHGAGDGGDFDFLVAGPWHDPVLTAHLPGWGVVTYDWRA